MPFTIPASNKVAGQANFVPDVDNAWAALAAIAGINVLNTAYAGGADPTGVADSTAAIQAAVNAAQPGQTVYLPPGTYLVSYPISVPAGVIVRGSGGSNQSAGSSGSQWGTVIVVAAGFTNTLYTQATGVFLVLGSASTGVDRVHFHDLMIYGHNGPASVDGIATYSKVNALIADRVLFQQITGSAFANYPDTSGNTAGGLLLMHCLAQAGAGIGFNLSSTDATLINCHAQSQGGDGFVIGGNSNTRLSGCRADLSQNGFTIIGPSGSAGGGANSGFSDSTILVGCGTQINARNGVNIVDNYTGTSTPAPSNVIIEGCSFDMDGANAGSGGGGYAGIAINGLAIVKIGDTNVLADTTGAASGSPQYAIATSASANGGRVPISVRVNGGYLSAQTAIFSDAAPASDWYIDPSAVTYVTQHASHIAAANVTPAPVQGFTATDVGYAGYAYDGMSAGNTATRLITAGTLNLIGVMVRKPVTVSTVALMLAGNGATLTAGQSLIGLYSSAGTLLGSSADQSGVWNAGASKYMTATLTAQSAGSLALQPGFYWVALLCNGTTMPSFFSGSNILTQNPNGALTAAKARYATNGSALTALPATFTPSSNTIQGIAWWAAIY